MVCLEGAGGGASGDGLEHGGFDFEEGAFVEEVADFRDHFGAGDEEGGGFGVADEVEMAFAVFCFPVGEAVEFVRHGAEGFGEDGEGIDFDGWFAGAGEECFAGDADPVAAVEAFPDGGLCFIEAFDGEVSLDGACGIADAEEDGFSHVAEGDDAACGGDLEAFGEVVFEVGGGGGGVEASAEGVDAEFTEFCEFFAADGDEFCFRLRRGFDGRVCRLRLGVGVAHVSDGVEEREVGGKRGLIGD